MTTMNAINAELRRLGACSTSDCAGLDCDSVENGVATFSDSQEVARYNAKEALAALQAADGGFDGAWQALVSLAEVTVTNDDIRQLRAEAAAHGDTDQVALCDRALGGDREAAGACVEAIRDAEAQADG